jgi:hypothetical protein
MVLIVAALVGLVHSCSLRTGLFLDDHAHFRQLRDGDWSYRSAVAAARLGIVGDVMDLWSHHETGLRFYRPIAFWLMRAEYTLVGWRPAGMHVFSLAWHTACAVLVGLIAWRMLRRWAWATVAAGLVAIHPGHVVTVSWIACQTELMTTAFVLTATLGYAAYAGWWRRAEDPPTTAAARRWPLAAALVFWAAGLGCREHAIMWPAVILAGDFAYHTGIRKRLGVYAAMAAIAIAYLALRQEALGGFPLPGHPYLVRPADPGFARFILEKLAYYFIGLFAYIPVLPIGGIAYLTSHPALFLGAVAGAAIGVLLAVLGARSRRVLFPLAWTFLFFVPLLPVFASAHHLYLPGAGMAWLIAMGLAALAARPGRAGRLTAGTVVGVHVVALSLVAWWFGWTYRVGTSVEDLVVRDVLENGRPLHDGDHLFFINVPMLAYYAIPAIENETGLHNLHGHLLTLAPSLLRMQSAGFLDAPDDRTLVVTAPPGAPYLAGATGRTMLAVMDIDQPLTQGTRLQGPLYDMVVEAADEKGLQRLRFEFHRPIDSPDYHLFFGSPTRWAWPVRGPHQPGLTPRAPPI